MPVRKLTLAILAAAIPALAHAAAAPAGNAAAGETAFKSQCAVCHATVDDGKVHPGPLLAGIVGRKAASVAGFNYSPALKTAAPTWTVANLDKFLNNAQGMVPGTFMVVKLSNPTTRQDVLAYLATLKAPAKK